MPQSSAAPAGGQSASAPGPEPQIAPLPRPSEPRLAPLIGVLIAVTTAMVAAPRMARPSPEARPPKARRPLLSRALERTWPRLSQGLSATERDKGTAEFLAPAALLWTCHLHPIDRRRAAAPRAPKSPARPNTGLTSLAALQPRSDLASFPRRAKRSRGQRPLAASSGPSESYPSKTDPQALNRPIAATIRAVTPLTARRSRPGPLAQNRPATQGVRALMGRPPCRVAAIALR